MSDCRLESMIDALPDEILHHIFRFMPSKCVRKSVSVVCRRWHQIANDRQFLVDDEIVLCPNTYTLGDVASTLSASIRETFSLHFLREDIRLTQESIKSWRMCGAKIVSLTFDDCDVDFGAVKRILELCPNVQRLSINVENYEAKVNRLFQNFDNFAQPDFLAPSVTSFHFEVCFPHKKINDANTFRILSMFPNLHELTLVHPGYSLLAAVNEYMMQFPLIGLYHYLDCQPFNFKTLNLYAELDFNFASDQRMHEYLNKILDKLKGKEVNFGVFTKLAGIPQFFSPQTILDRVTSLHVSFVGRTAPRNFLLEVLQRSPIIFDLNVYTELPLEIDAAVVRKILSSRIKTLFIKIMSWSQAAGNDENASMPENSFEPNYTLERITMLGQDPWMVQLWRVFLQYSRRLHTVFVYHPNDVILQNVFKYQKNLKSLSLKGSDKLTDFGFTGCRRTGDEEQPEETYTIRELKELEYFRLSAFQRNRLTKETFSHFVLPQLKTLKIDVRPPIQEISAAIRRHSRHPDWNEIYADKLIALQTLTEQLENSPLLKIIELGFPTIEPKLDNFRRLVKTLKHLRILAFYHAAEVVEIDESAAYHLFEDCPTLRSFCFNRKSFFYNILTKETELSADMRRGRAFKNYSVYTVKPGETKV